MLDVLGTFTQTGVLSRRTGATNELGEQTETFSELGEWRCVVMPGSGPDSRDEAGLHDKPIGRCYIDARCGARAEDRLVVAGVTYRVANAANSAGMGHHLRLVVQEEP